MNTAHHPFLIWLMSLTTITRYFVIAMIVHIAAMFGLAVIKLAPKIIPPTALPWDPPPLPPQEPTSPLPISDEPWNPDTRKTKGLGDDNGIPPVGAPDSVLNKQTTSPNPKQDTHSGPTITTDIPGLIGSFVRPDTSGSGIAAPTKGDLAIGKGVPFADAFANRPTGWGSTNGTPGIPTIGQLAPPETERAVIAGLRWLKTKQQPNGCWDGPYDRNANTALAILAFLGHGETTESREFGDTVNKGLSYLSKIIGPDGLVPGYSHRVYSQGAVTLALAEGYGMTRSADIKESLERAVKAIVAWQNAQGGWRYQFQSQDSDVSTSGWMIMALKSARLAGIEVPEDAFNRAASYLWSMYHPSGGFGYDTPSQRPSTTAIGVLCLQYMKHDGDRRITKALDYLKTFKADWQETSDRGLGLVLYWWYYHSQAMFQAGGDYWKNWRSQLTAVMVKNQQEDGHWEYPEKSNFEKNFKDNGYVYSTALCCLNLEVFYRYLPMHQELQKKGIALASR